MNKTLAYIPASLTCFQHPLAYSGDPTALFHALCANKTDCLLLESAQIDSKQNLKSLLLIDAALRIQCLERQVKLTALTPNGEHCLAQLHLSHLGSVTIERDARSITLHFPHNNAKVDEDARLRQTSVFDALRLIQHSFNVQAHNKFALFIAGLFSYDLVAQFEPLGKATKNTACPDYVFYVAEQLMIIDHQAQSCQLQTTAFSSEPSLIDALQQRQTEIIQQAQAPLALPVAPQLVDMPVTASVNDAAFAETVEQLKEYIINGDIFQVVPSRRFSLPCPAPLAAYHSLKNTNPSPYMFYMQAEDFTLFGASPESALKFDHTTNQVEIYPIAGTRRRAKKADGSIDHDLDSRIELELRSDKKENAEHLMLVDLARNDVARISRPQTRYVADLLKVDRYSHVMHLVSRVVGQLREDLDALHAYQACMNMGTLTGAPKIRAMQLIREVEGSQRGSYGGAVGYLTGQGDLDTCIVIRSAYVTNGLAQVQAGAGVVYDSDPHAEAEETRSKAQAVIQAIQKAHHYEEQYHG